MEYSIPTREDKFFLQNSHQEEEGVSEMSPSSFEITLAANQSSIISTMGCP